MQGIGTDMCHCRVLPSDRGCHRVGTGVSDEERKQISDKLKPLFLEANVKRANNPKCYKVTGHNKERPDVWISDPFKSVVLEVVIFDG